MIYEKRSTKKTYFVQLYDVGVTNLLKYINFSGHPLDVRFVFDFILLKNLNGDLLISNRVRANSNFAESSLTQ